MPQSSSNQTGQTTSGSPQANGATPPPDCVGKTATTTNLPTDCQIYFGLLPQPAQSQNPTSMNNLSQSSLASISSAFSIIDKEIQAMMSQ